MFTKSLLLVAGTCAALLLAEFAIRWWGIAPRLYKFRIHGADATFKVSTNPILGYEMRPNLRNESFDCHNTFPFTNSAGFRDIEHPTARKEAGAPRMLLLGDSVVAGHGLCNSDDILPRTIERASEGKLEVVSLAVGGYCTRSEVELLRERGEQYSPDVVGILFVENDYTDSNGTIIDSLNFSSRTSMRELLIQSALVRLVLARFEVNLQSGKLLKNNQSAIGSNNVEKGLQLLKELSLARGFTPLIITWPYFSDDKILEPVEQYTVRFRPDENILQLAEQYSIAVHQLSTDYKNDFEERKLQRKSKRKASPRWIYTQGDGVHPSPLGSELGGRFIYEGVRGVLQKEAANSSTNGLWQK